MNGHLEKAQGALAHAADLEADDPMREELLVIAKVQAEVASAEALTRLADAFAPEPHRADDPPAWLTG